MTRRRRTHQDVEADLARAHARREEHRAVNNVVSAMEDDRVIASLIDELCEVLEREASERGSDRQ